MVAPSSEPVAAEFSEDATRPAWLHTVGSDGPLRYRLDVAGTSAAEVVAGLGGWLFDRAMGGWEVSVYLRDVAGYGALEVLGARVYELDAAFAEPEPAQRPHGLAVATELFDTDDRVHREAVHGMRRSGAEVTFWGAERPARLNRAVHRVDYQPTLAAQAFKARAAVLAGLPATGGVAEAFFSHRCFR